MSSKYKENFSIRFSYQQEIHFFYCIQLKKMLNVRSTSVPLKIEEKKIFLFLKENFLHI